jgi:DNA-binding transcriptional regulator YdaS (Cro superfamily)
MLYYSGMNWKSVRSQSVAALQRAAVAAGGPAGLARGLDKSLQQVQAWSLPCDSEQARSIPIEVCPLIEKLYGVRCEDLRPDQSDYWALLRELMGSQVRAI